VNAEDRVVAAFRPRDFPMVPEVGAILANLPQRSDVPLDGQATLVETRAFFDTDAALGREWLAGLSVVPNRDLRVVLLTRSGSIANLVGDAAWLLYAAALPPMILVLLFVYLVQNEWRKEDRRVDHLVSLSNRLRHATNLLHVGVVDWSVRSGDVVLSAGWRRLLGYAPEEVANEIDEWHARLHPDDRDRALRAYQDLADGRMTDLRHRVRLIHRDGRVVPVDERGGAQTNRRGRVTHVVLVQEPHDPSGEIPP
jgi:PAS domain S-box-containing protein